MTKKYFNILCVTMVILFLVSGCAVLTNLTGQSKLQTYTFDYDGKEYSALIPRHVPMPPEGANLVPQSFWDGVYVMHVQYMAGKTPLAVYPVMSFWFTEKLGTVGLVWHTLQSDGAEKHECFLYVGSIPVPTDTADFSRFLNELPSK